MKRLLGMLVIIMCAPAAVMAQVGTIDPPNADEHLEAAGAAPPAQAAPAPAPRDATRPRRRGSMVGYIDDAVVGSKARIRFDAGLHNRVPDRAEFFYAKCGCFRDVPRTDPAFDPNAPGPRPGGVNDLNFQQLYFRGEYAVTGRVSAFGELPFRWIQPQSFIPGTGAGFPNQSGLADIRAGVKAALVSTDERVVTAQVQGFFAAGDSAKGLGTNHASIEPALLYYQEVSDRVAIESQVGVWHPFDGSAGVPTSTTKTFSGDVVFYGVGPSIEVYRRDRVRFAPVVELVGWRVVNGFQLGGPGSDASGTNIVNLKIGGRISWDPRGSFYAGFGHKLTSEGWYDDIVRLEYRYSF